MLVGGQYSRDGTRLRQAIVCRHVTIKNNCLLEEGAVIGDDVVTRIRELKERTERNILQYGFGDVIHIAVAGVNQQVTGTVEDVTLRVTRIRSVSGEVITTPNGQIVQVINLSRDWARAVIDVPVPASADVAAVSDHGRLWHGHGVQRAPSVPALSIT